MEDYLAKSIIMPCVTDIERQEQEKPAGFEKFSRVHGAEKEVYGRNAV